MPAANRDLTIEQGADFVLNLTWLTNAGAVIDLTGYTAAFTAKKLKSDTATILSATSAGGQITLSATAPNIVINIPGATTAAYDFITGFYNLDLTQTSSSDITRLLQGLVYLDKEV